MKLIKNHNKFLNTRFIWLQYLISVYTKLVFERNVFIFFDESILSNVMCYLNTTCALNGDISGISVGWRGVSDNVRQSSVLCRVELDVGSASKVKVCQWVWSSSSLRAWTNSRPVGARWTSRGLDSWNQRLQLSSFVFLIH